jgi:hypothetical protein
MPEQNKGILVFRFDYELNNNVWHAYVAGYGQEECQNYLFKTVGNVTLTGISQECPLHAISDELRAKILEASKRKPGRPPKKKD